LSPLHAFLGIDPITGQFKPAGGPRRPASAPNNPAEGAAGAESLSAAPAGGLETSTDFQTGEMSLDDFRSAITKAIDEHDDGALAATLANLTRGAGYESFSLLDPRIERIGYLVLFLYPLGIVISELCGVWARRHTLARTERDRHFFARQRNRRFTLAACSATTIGLFWWAGENSFWWSDPQRLGAFVVGLALLLAVSALLRLIIARAARDYPVRVIEDLRLQQLALEKEIQDLRRRLQGHALTDAVS
jgi:hypothetical protein